MLETTAQMNSSVEKAFRGYKILKKIIVKHKTLSIDIQHDDH